MVIDLSSDDDDFDNDDDDIGNGAVVGPNAFSKSDWKRLDNESDDSDAEVVDF